jgi:TonB family protein
MRNLVTAAIALSMLGSAATGAFAAPAGPVITKFEAEIGKWALRAGRSGCVHLSYKLNEEGGVYGVKVLGSRGHKSFTREAKYGVREMEVKPGSAPAGAYDVVVDFVVTKRTASSTVQANDAFERNPKVCPFTAKTEHEPIVISGEKQYAVFKKACDDKGVGSNMKTC